MSSFFANITSAIWSNSILKWNISKAKSLWIKGPVDKLKNYDLLYGIIIISISGGHFYDGEAGQPDPDGDIRHRLNHPTRPSFETD